MVDYGSLLRAYKTASWITPEELITKPKQGWKSTDYHVVPLTQVQPIDDKHIFDLGNYKFQVDISTSKQRFCVNC